MQICFLLIRRKKCAASAICFLLIDLLVLKPFSLSSLFSITRFNFFCLFLAKRGGERQAARFIISSRAKRACITQASQGQRDFLLAINLSSLVGVRLDVIQSSDVKAHYGFPGNQLPSTTKLWVLLRFFFSSVNYNNVYGR